MIVQVRGGSGSGKSTLVRKFLVEHNMFQEGELFSAKGSKFHLWRTPTVPIIGERKTETVAGFLYPSPCIVYVPGKYSLTDTSPGKGGEYVEGEQGLRLLIRLLRQGGKVLWETPKGQSEAFWGTLVAETRCVWATLNTPPDECIRRIYARREATGRRLGAPLKEESMKTIIRQRLRSARQPPPGVESYFLTHTGDTAFHELNFLLGIDDPV
jgi:hypothetical protein